MIWLFKVNDVYWNNKPKVNEDPKDALLKQYEEEIKKLKDMLDRMNSGKGLGQ